MKCQNCYEQPKEKKKWAPAWFNSSDAGWVLDPKLLSSEEEAKKWFGSDAEIVWPAPGFTPTELPE